MRTALCEEKAFPRRRKQFITCLLHVRRVRHVHVYDHNTNLFTGRQVARNNVPWASVRMRVAPMAILGAYESRIGRIVHYRKHRRSHI